MKYEVEKNYNEKSFEMCLLNISFRNIYIDDRVNFGLLYGQI